MELRTVSRWRHGGDRLGVHYRVISTERKTQSIGKAVKTLIALVEDKNRNGVDCTKRLWKTIKSYLRKQGYADMIKYFYWDEETQKLHTKLPIGKFCIDIKPKS